MPESDESGCVQFRVEVGSKFAHDRFEISNSFMNAWEIDEIISGSGALEEEQILAYLVEASSRALQ
jgi:hypothetical protein